MLFDMLTNIQKSVKVIPQLARLICDGSVVVAPTETAYGLLADATNTRAVAQVVRIKGREPGKPIALVAADFKMVKKYFFLNVREQKMAKKFWPGPLTLLLKPKFVFSRSVIGPRGLVGVRVPGLVWLRRLITTVNKPLTATSANVAGGPTLYSVAAVRRALKKRGLRYLVNGGVLQHRSTSTVVSLGRGKLHLVREGAVSRARIERALA